MAECKNYAIEVREEKFDKFIKDFPRIHCSPVVFGRDVVECYPDRVVLVVVFDDELEIIKEYVRGYGQIFEMRKV